MGNIASTTSHLREHCPAQDRGVFPGFAEAAVCNGKVVFTHLAGSLCVELCDIVQHAQSELFRTEVLSMQEPRNLVGFTDKSKKHRMSPRTLFRGHPVQS